jgi:hypothetical protein
MPFDKKLLLYTWMHSYEEDTAEKMIFRKDNHPLPPSRGRVGYSFNSDGSVIKIAPDPVDRLLKIKGKWTIDHVNQIKIQIPGTSDIVFRVSSLDKDCLIIKK